MSFVSVVQISGVVCNFVGQIDELGFQRWAQVKQVLGKFRKLYDAIVCRVLDDSFPHLERQVKSAKCCVAQLEVLNDAERMQIVVEEISVCCHGRIKRLLASMSEGWMADVVR